MLSISAVSVASSFVASRVHGSVLVDTIGENTFCSPVPCFAVAPRDFAMVTQYAITSFALKLGPHHANVSRPVSF